MNLFQLITTKELFNKFKLINFFENHNILLTIYNITDEYIRIEFENLYEDNIDIINIINNLKYEQLIWKTNKKIHNSLDILILGYIFNKKIKVDTFLDYRIYKYENDEIIYISSKNLSYYFRLLEEIAEAYVILDYRFMLLPYNNNIIKHTCTPVWYTYDKKVIKDLNNKLKEYNNWVWVDTTSTIHLEITTALGLEVKIFGPFDNKYYHLVNIRSEHGFILGSCRNIASTKVSEVISYVRFGLLPTISIKIDIEIDKEVLYFVAILILDYIWSESKINIPINLNPYYTQLFNYISVTNDILEIPISSLQEFLKFKSILYSLYLKNFNIYEGSNPINEHLSYIDPSLYYNNKVVYLKDNKRSPIINLKVKNDKDPITLDEFDTMTNEEKYQIICIQSHGYLANSLSNLIKPFPVLPYNREPYIDNTNLKLSGIISHHHKEGIIANHNIRFELKDNKYVYKKYFLYLPTPIIKFLPYYTPFMLDNMFKEKCTTLETGYIQNDNTLEIYQTPYKIYTISIGTININFIDENNNIDNIYKDFIDKYTRGYFIPIWKQVHPYSKLSFRANIPSVTDLGVYNDYVINWFKQ